MNNIQIFNNNEFGEIRTVVIDGEPWFVAKDIAEKLGYVKASNMTKLIDDDDRRILERSEISSILEHTSTPYIGVINESGLYAAIFGSKQPNAMQFKRWVTKEVLPTIRKTGSYGVPAIPTSPQEQIKLIAQGYTELAERMDAVTDEVQAVKTDFKDFQNELPMFPVDMQRITDAVYRDIYNELHRNFGCSTYKSIARKHCDRVVEVIDAYIPPIVPADRIAEQNIMTA